jgi:RNA polymerase sigma-70 factor (ECF subfamily)
MKRRSFLRVAAVPVLCAAALLVPQGASATVESQGAAAKPAPAQVADVLTAGLPAAKVLSARRLAVSQRLPEQLDRLYREAWALCGSSHDADDLVQETFARVLARPRRLRRDDELPYLLQAMRNTYLTGLRTRGRRPQTVELPAEASETLRSSRAEPEAAFEQRELLATIAALPPDFRDALVAIDLVGLSYREGALLLGVPEATITTRLYRARQRVVHTLTDTDRVTRAQ